MTDVFSKILAVCLAFVLCILSPIALTSLMDDMVARRSIMNEMSAFIDEVIDSGKITDEQMADFQLGCNSYGPVVNIEIRRYVKTTNPDPKNPGKTYTSYVMSDTATNFNQGDHIQVTVETIGYTGSQRIVMATLGTLLPRFNCTFSARVR